MTNIFVGNLSYRATESDLRHAFECYGRVTGVRIVSDRDTGRSRGFGFVDMPRLEDADEAINRLNNSTFCGRPISVNESRAAGDSPRSTPSRPRTSALLDAL